MATASQGRSGRALIASRLDRLAFGHTGDAKAVEAGVFELRIHFGPGYRIYYARRGEAVILLLCGGDKGSQTRTLRWRRAYLLTWSS